MAANPIAAGLDLDLSFERLLVVERADDLVRIDDGDVGVGVDVAIECVGNEKALATCMESVRRRGTVVQVGLPTRAAAIDLHKLVTKDITYRGSLGI